MNKIFNKTTLIVTFSLVVYYQINVYATDGRVKVKETHQTMEGFGASVAYYDNWLTAHPNKAAIYEFVFYDLGLDILRLRNMYNNTGGNFAPDSKQIVEQMYVNSEIIPKIMISSWSPPANLKSNGSTQNGGTLKKENGNYVYGAFAQFWVNSLNAYEALGIVPDYISIQNEPDWSTSWETCLFDPAENSSNAGYNRALDTVYTALQQLSSPPKILGPEVLGIGYSRFQNYAAQFNHSHLDAYAYHLYHGESVNDDNRINPDVFNSNLSAIAASYQSKPIFQTEYDRGDWFYTVWLMHNCLVNGNVSGYLWWGLVWDANSTGARSLVGLENPWNQSSWNTSEGFILTQFYWAFRQYSKFIDSGWKRVTTEVDVDSLRMSAYINPDGNSLTVVILNIGSTSKTMGLDIQDFNVTGGIIVRTSDTEQGELVSDNYDGKSEVEFPPRSITTFSLWGELINSAETVSLNPAEFILSQNYPNPFNPSTTIRYTLNKSSKVKVTIYNVLGINVRTLIDSYQNVGEHSLLWNGTDDYNKPVATGVYIYRIESGDLNLKKRMLLIR
jgi:glucuronoarabinoxylan endo-1,4-beta-xylanase